MENLSGPIIRVNKNHAHFVRDNAGRVGHLFSVRFCEVLEDDDSLSDVYFKIESNDREINKTLVEKIQRQVDWLISEEGWTTRGETGGSGGGGGGGGCGGEDSSYDSDYDGEETKGGEATGHIEVSRTASDTLGAEFAEYVTTGGGGGQEEDEAYTSRLEFALKLGYTERQVQAALAKLGPSPAQNELLAELIKIGAQGQCQLGGEGTCDWEDEEPYTFEPSHHEETKLRPVVIDGSNVAMSHGNKEVFSCRGIKICVDWFRTRGHKEITVFVPKWRKEASRPDNPITDQEILGELERERLLVFTPSRLVGGKRLVCYDDRYILKLAADNGGIVVSNDNYRDLAQENPEFRKVVEERILMYSFVNDRFMPPDDPLGRSGPTLDNFLRVRRTDPPPPCPYAKKCTYGVKCKFQHPERGAFPHKTVTERLVEHAQRQLQARASETSPGKQLKGKSLSLPLSMESDKTVRKAPLARTKSVATGTVISGSDGSEAALSGGAIGGGAGTGANLHKKLARQLTLNPVSDPRLWKHHGVARHFSCDSAYPPGGMGGALGAAAASGLLDPYGALAGPRAAISTPPPPIAPPSHNNVARICSAPSPATGLPRMRPLSSASDPQLGRVTSDEDKRRLLHYHLASIFPEEQVSAAMQLYPLETNPQKICAAILTLFPSV